MRFRRERSPDGFDEAGEPFALLTRSAHPRRARVLHGAGAVVDAVYAGNRLTWPVRLGSWFLAGASVAYLAGPEWIPAAVIAAEECWIVAFHVMRRRHGARQRTLEEAASAARAAVFAAFGAAGIEEWLPGGEAPAWRMGDLVLKRGPSDEEWSWLGEHLPSVRADGFRLALPVPARDGQWVVDGWCAQTWVGGSRASERDLVEVVRVADRVDAALRHLPRPGFIDRRTHAYAVADRVAWEELDPPVEHAFLDRLLALRSPLDLPSQLVHGDLTDNVLIEEGRSPAVIDPTMYWRPAGFAGAIVIGDAVRWAHADVEALAAASSASASLPQLYVRAAIFRLVTRLLFGEGGVGPFARDVEVAERLAERR